MNQKSPIAPAARLPSHSALALAERSAPRYTSYPTAPHFSPQIDGAAAANWMGALADSASLSLYLHVPYCRAICNYCGCHTKAALRDEPLELYVQKLVAEIALTAKATKARRVTHIHWGGGTPGLLGPQRLQRLVAALGEHFDTGGVVEHAIELDPRHVDRALADALAECGVNRVSFGVQDINAHVQKAIGRIQPPEQVEQAAGLIRAAGISAINLDLMYGLPEQIETDVARTARWAASLEPARLAIFGYAHVPWMKKHQRLIDEAALPGAAQRMAQEEIARAALLASGYEAVGLDHFARPQDGLAVAARSGTLRRNFQGYTADAADALLPLGASSIGFLPQGFIQNAPDIGAWMRAVDEGHLACTRGIAINDDDRLRARVIERLMCDYRIDFGAYARGLTGYTAALDDAIGALDELQAQGIAVRTDRVVKLTPAGRPFVRLVAAAFDAYLQRGAAKHSLAV